MRMTSTLCLQVRLSIWYISINSCESVKIGIKTEITGGTNNEEVCI